jgi:hypothetical protein
LLAAGAGFFLTANRWVVVPLTTVIAVYSTHASLAFDGATSADLRLAFVVVDCALFAIASLRHPELRLVRVLAVANWIGAMLLGGAALLERSDTALFVAGSALAVAYGGLALLARWRRAAPAYVAVHCGIAIATLAVALPAQLEGGALVVGWLGLAGAATAIARRGDARFGVLAGLLLVAAYGAGDEARLGGLALLGCVGVGFAIERLHAPAARRSGLRLVLVAGVAAGLADVATLVVPSGLHTLATVGVGGLLFAIGFALQARPYRVAAFVVLAAATLRLLSVELAMFSAGQRILTFVLGGLALLVVSFVYHRRRAM